MKFGTKVKAYANSEEARVGFVVNPVANEDNKYGVQVGDAVYALSEVAPVEGGPNGGTFSCV